MGRKWGRVFRNYYKGHMDKTKEVWNQGRELGMAGMVGTCWGEGRKLYLNKNKIQKYLISK